MDFPSEKIENSLIEKPRAFSSDKEGNKSNWNPEVFSPAASPLTSRSGSEVEKVSRAL